MDLVALHSLKEIEAFTSVNGKLVVNRRNMYEDICSKYLQEDNLESLK